jgi:aminopeptidase N
MKAVFISCLVLFPCVCFSQLQSPPSVERGVSKNLAVFRKQLIKDVRYKLSFNIPSDRNALIPVTEMLTFNLQSNNFPVQVDFKNDKAQISVLKINGRPSKVDYGKEHLLLEKALLQQGVNTVQIEFNAGSAALNRNEDYLYTLFVPDRARTVFPCFDQPDLKAIFELKLELPRTWNVIANGGLKDSVIVNDRKTCSFKPSDKISTYLFSFAAGKFKSLNNKAGKYNAEFLYRETDPVKIKMSLDSIFKGHADAVKFLADWTNIPYPFQKLGFVAIPDFQFGGMEHVGAVQYKSSTLFLDDGATKDQLIARANLISHETAHMWFGDLVSINWFNDVWMKEVFANFMADKLMEKLTGTEAFNLKFLTDHFPAAYNIDRTLGANPIRQDLENLNQAGSLYGNIIYHKAPIVMRQLERLMGRNKFQAGVREYLGKYAYGNASWPDLIGILNKHSDVNLLNWNTVWVNDAGRPVFDYSISYNDGKINEFNITQRPEYGPDRVWPEIFEVSLVYPDHVVSLTVNMTTENLKLKEAVGLAKPLYVVFNSTGSGYGVWPVDTQMLNALYTMKSPVMRAAAYVSLYENMLNGSSIKPAALLDLFAEGLNKEKEELNLKLLTGYIGSLFWSYTKPEERENISVRLEAQMWSAMEHQVSSNNKKLLFKAYQDVFTNRDAYQKLAYIWKLQQAPAGIKLTEDDYTSLAFSLCLRSYGDTSILAQQLERINNPDRRKRFEFIAPAVSADVRVRDAFFMRLAERKNREKESNVISALYYLHHPLRQQHSVKYLKKSLDMLEEIQETGDIFFPQSWLQATFSYYQNKEAMQVISDFLAAHPDYNPKLKAKILQAADPVFRAQKLLF